jgi:serine/threonine-protein kinase
VSAKTNGLSAGLRIAAGSIELVKELGRGGIGSVWQGRIVATGDLVAIKFLDQDFNQHPGIVSSFERDVDALTALAGAAVPAMVRSATFEDSRHFYVYEYAENACSLATVLESRDAPLSKKLDVLCAVAQVLHGLHKQGWIHGDVKPANILLVGGIDGNVKFIDFGSAARIGERGSHDTITFTYAYAAPELLNLMRGTVNNTDSGSSVDRVRIHAEIRPTYDIYPLGVMLFQALDPGLARSTRMEEYWLISQLVTTPNLKAVVRKALAREPKDRFQTALEFLVALRGALTSAIEDSDS